MTPIRGVLFDIDDTLVDTASAFGSALRGSLGIWRDLSDAEAAQVLATWRADAGGHYRAYVAGQLGFDEQRRQRLAPITDMLALPRMDDERFAAWDIRYRALFAQAWTAFDDARGCVQRAVADGLAVGIVTNAPAAMQETKLSAVGLADLLPVMVAVDTLGVGKPDPRVFAEGCRRLGTEPAETIYVGDEPDIDAVGATQAGLRGVWIDRPGRRRGDAQVEGVEIVTSLTDLPRIWSS